MSPVTPTGAALAVFFVLFVVALGGALQVRRRRARERAEAARRAEADARAREEAQAQAAQALATRRALLADFLSLVERTRLQLAVDDSTLPASRATLLALLRDALDGRLDNDVPRPRLREALLRLAAFQPGPLDLPAAGDVPTAWTSLPPAELRALLITVRDDAVADLLIRVELEEKRLERELERHPER